jgi:hypothetical protein
MAQIVLKERKMDGYMLTFFTQQDRRRHGTPLADWLVELAAELGLGGA